MTDLPNIAERTFTVEEMTEILNATARAQSNFRKLDKGLATRYRIQMETGYWVWTDAAPVRIHEDPTWGIICTDGQHRFHAAILANRPLRTFVLVGIPAGIHTDRGQGRTDGQLLRGYGVKDATRWASASRHYLALIRRGSVSHIYYAQRYVASEDVIDLVLHRDRDADTQGTVIKGMAAAGLLVARMVLRDIDKDLADEFWAGLLNPDPDSPQMAIRGQAARQFSTTGEAFPLPKTYAGVTRAFDAEIGGITRTHFKLAGGWDDLMRLPATYRRESLT